MPKNPMGKTVKKENAYAVYRGGGFDYLVLKTYQSAEKEDANPYARWFLATRSPYTYGSWELGDGYVRDVKRSAYRLLDTDADAFLKREFGDKAGITKVTA